MRKEADRADTVYRIDVPDPSAFQRGYVRRRRPVVLLGVCDGWPARHWDVQKLREKAGQDEVDVAVYPRGDFYDEKTMRFERMKVGDYLDTLERPPDSPRRSSLIDRLSSMPRLESEVTVPPLFPRRRLLAARLDVRRDPVSPNRFHPYTEYLLCQLAGEQRVVLYPPEDTPHLYPQPIYTYPDSASSMVDLSRPDYARYPRLRKAHPVEVTLRPGQCLYVPLHFWCWVTGSGLSIAVDFFFRASLRSWRPSAAALRIAAGYPIEKVRYRVGRMLSARAG